MVVLTPVSSWLLVFVLGENGLVTLRVSGVAGWLVNKCTECSVVYCTVL